MAKGVVCFGTFFFVVVVTLVGYGVEGKLPDIGKCPFKHYMCSVRECSTMFYKGVQKNPDDCSGAFLSVRWCIKNLFKVCLGSLLNDEQLENAMKAGFKEEVFCNDAQLEVPTPPPGIKWPCTQNFTSVTENCEKPFRDKFRANKADTQLCSSYADAKQCQRNAFNSLCNFTYPIETLDFVFDNYNPFCDNYRDPGATGPGYCDGVAVITPTPAATAAGLTPEPAFGAFVVLLGAASATPVGLFLIW